MRSGAWLVVAGGVLAAAAGCSGGYPLAPTACDDWCHATKGETCPEYYDPARCVSECEDKPRLEHCHAELQAEVACFRKDSSAAQARCDWYYDQASLPCAAEMMALALCLAPPVESIGQP